MEVNGLPPEDVISSAVRRRLFFDSRGNPRCITNSKGRKRKPGSKSLVQALRCSDTQFIHFVSRCLEWDPTKRMTPDEAAHHEWLQPSSSSSYYLSKVKELQENLDSLHISPKTHSSQKCSQRMSTATVAQMPSLPSHHHSSQHLSTSSSNNTIAILPDIKSSKYGCSKYGIVRSKITNTGLTASVTDLDSAQHQYSLHRMYHHSHSHHGSMHTSATANSRKLMTQSGTIVANGSSSSGKSAGVKGQSTSSSTNNINNNNVTHSQSTGDVSTIFGRA